MKISTKGRYGLTIVVVLGKTYGDGPFHFVKLLKNKSLSEAYLEQLVSPLRNADL